VEGRAKVYAVVAAGGALGSLGRWGVAELLPPAPRRFPVATFAVNVTGCLLIGVLLVLVLDVWPPRRLLRPFLAVGVLGGFTTFSAYAAESRALLADGVAPLGVAYLLGSLLAGLAAVWVGVTLTRVTVGWRRRGGGRPR
jgi:CrcB protein